MLFHVSAAAIFGEIQFEDALDHRGAGQAAKGVAVDEDSEGDGGFVGRIVADQPGIIRGAAGFAECPGDTPLKIAREELRIVISWRGIGFKVLPCLGKEMSVLTFPPSWSSCRRRRLAAGSDQLSQIVAHGPPPRRAGARPSQEQSLNTNDACLLSSCGNSLRFAGRNELQLTKS